MNTVPKEIAEEIRKALEYSERLPSYRDHVENNADRWLRSLLEDNKELREKEFIACSKHHEFIEDIERLEAELAATKYEITEIGKEATAGLNGDLERADAALQRIDLLSKNILATINESKPDTAATTLG